MPRLLFALMSLLFVGPVVAQTIARIDVHIPHATGALNIPVQTSIDGLTQLTDNELALIYVQSGKRMSVPFQIVDENGKRTLHFLIPPIQQEGGKPVFELVRKREERIVFPMLRLQDEKGGLTVKTGAKNLLHYQSEKLDAPEGVDPSYGRSGFIHPLWTPSGKVLTRIQPPDHYHHYGIWNPWTHVMFEGDTIDFWNLNKKEGTVRFSKFLGRTEGPVFTEFAARHEHVVLGKNGKEKIALNEVQTVRAYSPGPERHYVVDITIELTCAGKSPFRILAYRYAGLGWRTTEKWDNKNSEVLTSEGKSRRDADGSNARWCLVQGAIDKDDAGALIMSFPANYNHPEPLRIWPENQYDRGDMFVNFSPTKNKDWELFPGDTYTLRYRFIVFDGKFDSERSEAAWRYFAEPIKITVTKR